MNYSLKEHFDRMANNNMIGHAFLIGNATFENIKDDLQEILNTYFFENDIQIDNFPDVLVVKPENDKIVKADILNLQEKFMTYSQLNNNKVYIIEEAEKMNEYASNSLLKFLEEPEKNIYAFLITGNVQRILPTIKSRCQVLMVANCFQFNINDYEIDFVKKVIDFLNTIENKKTDTIAYVNNFFNKKEDKEVIVNMIKISKYFYRDILNLLYFDEPKYFSSYKEIMKRILSLNDEQKITNKLLVLSQAENMLQYNVNLGLFIDKLIIDLGRC